MKIQNKGYRGYIFSREINNQYTSQKIQNMTIRDYAKKNNLFFLLSATEYKMKGSFFILNSIFSDLKDITGIIFFSLFQLPIDKTSRNKIYKLILFNKLTVHFASEDIVLKNEEDISIIELYLFINKNSKSAILNLDSTFKHF